MPKKRTMTHAMLVKRHKAAAKSRDRVIRDENLMQTRDVWLIQHGKVVKRTVETAAHAAYAATWFDSSHAHLDLYMRNMKRLKSLRNQVITADRAVDDSLVDFYAVLGG